MTNSALNADHADSRDFRVIHVKQSYGIFTTSFTVPVLPSASLARIPIKCSPVESSGVKIL